MYVRTHRRVCVCYMCTDYSGKLFSKKKKQVSRNGIVLLQAVMDIVVCVTRFMMVNENYNIRNVLHVEVPQNLLLRNWQNAVIPNAGM